MGRVGSVRPRSRRRLRQRPTRHRRQLPLELVVLAAHRLELVAQRATASAHGGQLIGQGGRLASIRRVAFEQLGAPLPIPVGIDSVRHVKHQPAPERVHSAGQRRRRRRQRGSAAAPTSSHQALADEPPTTSHPQPWSTRVDPSPLPPSPLLPPATEVDAPAPDDALDDVVAPELTAVVPPSGRQSLVVWQVPSVQLPPALQGPS